MDPLGQVLVINYILLSNFPLDNMSIHNVFWTQLCTKPFTEAMVRHIGYGLRMGYSF